MNYALIAKPWRKPPFEGFPPLDGTVPELPFEYLPRIADRARKLLSDRTNEEVILAAELIDGVMDVYFDSIRSNVAFELLKQYPGSAKILSKDFMDGDELAELRRMEKDIEELMCDGFFSNLVLSVPNYPTQNSLGDIDSLKEIAEFLHFQLPSPAPTTLDEYFAVLALRHVEDCSGFLAAAFQGGDSTQSGQPSPNLVFLLTAATQALAIALEAVCYAEHLSVLQKIGVPLVGEKKPLEDLAQEFHRSVVTHRARLGATARHKENRQLQEDALKYYKDNEKNFKSVQEAARAIAGKIVCAKHLTVVGWISDFKKKREAGNL